MLGPWQIAIIVILAVVLLGGRGKISSIMADMAGGIKAFRKGMAEDDAPKDDKASLTDEPRDPIEQTDENKTR